MRNIVVSRFLPTRGQPPEPAHAGGVKDASANAEAPPEAARSVVRPAWTRNRRWC